MDPRKRKYYMMTKALTGLFLFASASCLALCAYKRMQCKKDAPQKADTDQSPQKETTLAN
jgi:hypothetical protein